MLRPELFIVGLALMHFTCSLNHELLSILEHTLTGSRSKKCDLAVFGQDLMMDICHELQRPIILILGSTDADNVIKKSLIVPSSCLILLMFDRVSINDLKYLGDTLVKIIPIGAMYKAKNNEWRILAEDLEHQTLSFPVIFQKVNGKSHH